MVFTWSLLNWVGVGTQILLCGIWLKQGASCLEVSVLSRHPFLGLWLERSDFCWDFILVCIHQLFLACQLWLLQLTSGMYEARRNTRNSPLVVHVLRFKGHSPSTLPISKFSNNCLIDNVQGFKLYLVEAQRKYVYCFPISKSF